jgi:hypothetical protein
MQTPTSFRNFLHEVESLKDEEEAAAVLHRAAYEVLKRLVKKRTEFDLSIVHPDGPTWAYVLSAGLRRDIETPSKVVDDLYARPIDLAEGEIMETTCRTTGHS